MHEPVEISSDESKELPQVENSIVRVTDSWKRYQMSAPEVVAQETVTRVGANQAQLINRLRSANLLLENETMFLLELQPAAYVAVAANEAEKRAPIKLVYAAMLGATGRLIV